MFTHYLFRAALITTFAYVDSQKGEKEGKE